MDFTAEGTAKVERALETVRPGRWRRLSERELEAGRTVYAVAGWRVDLPNDATRVATVDHLQLYMDAAFPFSELRVAVPGVKGVEWPHLEEDEVLCLGSTSASSSVPARLETVLRDALDLLNWDEAKRRAEFGREIYAYWSRRARDSVQIYSLADPAGPTRQASYCLFRDGILVADNEEEAHRWLLHITGQKNHPRMRKTAIIRLPGPLLPSEYPADGAALVKLAGPKVLDDLTALNREVPILLAFHAESGPGFVGVLIQSPTRQGKVKGYRPGHQPPSSRRSFASMPAQLCRVERVDRAWAHGRDHGYEIAALQGKRVAVIGCGALGGLIGVALAQAGVGRLWFIDGDIMHSHNPARHVLGSQYLRWPKAGAMAAEVRRHTPTILESVGHPRRFEGLAPETRDALSKFDLLICAGVDRRGEVQIDRWREALAEPPALMCTFSEEYALVGHAIAILKQDHLSDRYDGDGNFDFMATAWPAGAATIREAGCGNDFQPFGMIDLIPTAQMASQLALDVLRGTVSISTRRVWFGERDRVSVLGGKANGFFTGSLSIHAHPWGKG